MNNKRTFFQYVIPSVLSFALSGVYVIVDGFFVGNSIGDAGLSAINIAYPITAVLQSVGTGIGMGGSVKYSILKAAGNEKKAREFVAGATWLMLLFSAVLTVTVFFTSEKILSALGASGELLILGNEYIKVIALGAILQVFGTGLVPFMRNYGGSLWAMIAMICGFATNVALDYTFVWVLGRGMYGAALATIIGQGVTMAVALVYCAIKKNLTLKIALAHALIKGNTLVLQVVVTMCAALDFFKADRNRRSLFKGSENVLVMLHVPGQHIYGNVGDFLSLGLRYVKDRYHLKGGDCDFLFLGYGLSVLADYGLLRVRVDFLHFLFDFIGRRGNDFNSLLPSHHISLKVVLPSGKARQKGSVRLLHGDKDGVSEAVIMEF